LVVDGLKESEEADPLIVEVIMAVVQNGGDPSHDPGTFSGQEILGLGMFMEGMSGPVEDLGLFPEKGGDPRGIVCVDLPGETNEPLQIPGTLNWINLQFRSIGHLSHP
jgi:hypothetical protein